MTDLAPRVHPALAAQLADIRAQLRGMLGEVYQAADLPRPDRRERNGDLAGHYWSTGVKVCSQSYARPVSVIVLDEDVPDCPIVTLQGTDCAFPTDIKAITAEDARRLANALLAAANIAEGLGAGLQRD
jgi:hypothetical protein